MMTYDPALLHLCAARPAVSSLPFFVTYVQLSPLLPHYYLRTLLFYRFRRLFASLVLFFVFMPRRSHTPRPIHDVNIVSRLY